jgi:hypothetical protein
MARRDLDDDALSTGAADTELIELPSTTADSPWPPTRDCVRCIDAAYVPKRRRPR